MWSKMFGCVGSQIIRSTVQHPPAYLATTTTRLCINVAQSAHTRRETYIGTWLPEPLDTSSDPTVGTERGEALKLTVLTLLEKLSPTERAAYVLREAFDYSYREIGEILQMEEANVRQLVSRARKHISEGWRTPVSADEQRRLLDAFIAAAQKADMAGLEALFADDVVSTSDGGGIVRAARVPVVGRERVAKFIAAAAHFWQGVTLAWVETNGQAAVLVSRDGSNCNLLPHFWVKGGLEKVGILQTPQQTQIVMTCQPIKRDQF